MTQEDLDYYRNEPLKGSDIFSLLDAYEELQTELKDSEEKLETLVNVVSDCLDKMSSEECYNTLREIVEHYEKLNQGDEG